MLKDLWYWITDRIHGRNPTESEKFRRRTGLTLTELSQRIAEALTQGQRFGAWIDDRAGRVQCNDRLIRLILKEAGYSIALNEEEERELAARAIRRHLIQVGFILVPTDKLLIYRGQRPPVDPFTATVLALVDGTYTSAEQAFIWLRDNHFAEPTEAKLAEVRQQLDDALKVNKYKVAVDKPVEAESFPGPKLPLDHAAYAIVRGLSQSVALTWLLEKHFVEPTDEKLAEVRHELRGVLRADKYKVIADKPVEIPGFAGSKTPLDHAAYAIACRRLGENEAVAWLEGEGFIQKET